VALVGGLSQVNRGGALRSALAGVDTDRVVYDLDGIEAQYDTLVTELPGVHVRFSVKACPVGEVLSCLAARGAGADAASPAEIIQAIRAGMPADDVHYGNTIKSDRDIAVAYRLGVRDFVTDSVQDVRAIAVYAPGSRVFCRLATTGEGALWGLSDKFGCAPDDAVTVLSVADSLGLVPAGLAVHVGSQQMTVGAWRRAVDQLADTVRVLTQRGIHLRFINLGGGLPALGYLNRAGRPLQPDLTAMFTELRSGMELLNQAAGRKLAFMIEPGRHLVADHGAIRAHVVRLTARQQLSGEREFWLYLSCGRFNGLNETDQLHYRLEFPESLSDDLVPAIIAGPTCDSADMFDAGHRVMVPRGVASGDPVWVLSSGAYSVSYMTQGFNGFAPLPTLCVRTPGDARPWTSGLFQP
jgi:ornithine decarboxylase